MKKAMALFLAGLAAVSVTAAAASAEEEKDLKVAMICDTSIKDGGWGTACYNAMVEAAGENGWSYEVTDNIGQDEYYEAIIAYCERGYDMIYAPGGQYTDAVLTAAEEYPEIAFALLNGAATVPGKAANGNVTSLLPDAQQIGWIAGALAGLMTKSGTIAFIGGMELDTTLGKYAGYGEAAAYVAAKEGKEVKVLDPVYAGAFDARDKGVELAEAMIDEGADVFFGDASAVDSGARQAIDAANQAVGEVAIYDIAQPADTLGQNECIICSQVTNNAAMISISMQAVEAGSFGGVTMYGMLQNGALSAGEMSDLVPEDVREKYQAYLQQMIDGTFMEDAAA